MLVELLITLLSRLPGPVSIIIQFAIAAAAIGFLLYILYSMVRNKEKKNQA